MAWSTSDIKKDGQTDWLVRLYEKTINGIRNLETKEILINVPTLAEQASVMRYRDPITPDKALPTGVIKFF